MKRHAFTAAAMSLAAAATVSVGCETAQPSQSRGQASAQPRALVGTWRAADSSPRTGFNFGSVTFAPDGTYTAEMEYEDEIHANSGGWLTRGDELRLTNPNRRYTYELRGDTLVITDPERRISVPMRRYSVAGVTE